MSQLFVEPLEFGYQIFLAHTPRRVDSQSSLLKSSIPRSEYSLVWSRCVWTILVHLIRCRCLTQFLSELLKSSNKRLFGEVDFNARFKTSRL
ncbi:hypothetical protein DJ83_12575 [Halorubrum ezzemoulense]|uniref:Uncharacterized protein n=1 Tax=Halorubrum ezzemoulense TaxID=337243 RepID=A0A256ISC9_HALEZ|nr:hypothetical protein DJ83_12575 [Halorubrum ezzemoulense]RLM62501.1 hypothetical protein DVK07_18855 [Halorubrum sp. Atlit-26R]